jgi:hypothetical protein
MIQFRIPATEEPEVPSAPVARRDPTSLSLASIACLLGCRLIAWQSCPMWDGRDHRWRPAR